MKIIEDITHGSLKSAYVDACVSQGKKALKNKGYEIISLEQMAQLMIQEGNDSFLRMDNLTREGFLYVPKKGRFLTKNSPIMEATEIIKPAPGSNLTSEQIEKALADSCKVPEIGKIDNYTQKEVIEIPTLRLSEEEFTSYAFGKQAKKYGEFLHGSGVDYLKFYPDYRVENEPHVNPSFLHGILFNKLLLLGDMLLIGNWSERIRGVKEK